MSTISLILLGFVIGALAVLSYNVFFKGRIDK
jgi:hypothetical protein